MVALSPEWNGRIKSVVEIVEGQVPYGGWILKGITEVIWPIDQPNIWNLVKEQVSQLIDSKILANELQNQQEAIDAWQRNIDEYNNAQGLEKSEWLICCLDDATKLYVALTDETGQQNRSIHFVLLAVIVAQLHLGLLCERLQHGKEMFTKDDSARWRKELVKQYKEYKAYFNRIFPKWVTWRESQINIKTYISQVGPITWDAYGEVTDGLTNEFVKHCEPLCVVVDYFAEKCADTKERMKNDAIANMVGKLSSTFKLDLYIPDPADRPAVDEPPFTTFCLGPYSRFTVGIDKDAQTKTNIDDGIATLTQILVREYNAIDALQFQYTDHPGHLVGDPNGGAPHTFDVTPAKYCTGMKIIFPNRFGIICGVNIAFSDGTWTGLLGNRTGWEGKEVNATVDSTFRLAGGSFTQGYGPSHTQGIDVIRLNFHRV